MKENRKLRHLVPLSIEIALFAITLVGMVLRAFRGMGAISVCSLGIDFISMIVFFILFLACIEDEERVNTDLGLFMQLLVLGYVDADCDLLGYLADGIPSMAIAAKIVDTGIFLTNSTLTFLLWQYVVDIMRVKNRRRIQKLTTVWRWGGLINGLLIIGNIFGGYYFVIDRLGVYSRGPFFPVSMIYPYVASLSVIILIVVNRRRLLTRQIVILLLYVFTPLICGVISAIFYGISFSMLGFTVTYLLMYSFLNVEKAKEAAVVENELAVANEIQRSLLPQTFPAFPDRTEFDIHATMVPAKEVGGDLYDFFFIDDNTFAFLVGDVSGKGASAALFMTIAKTLIKNRAQAGGDPAGILTDVGNILAEDNEKGLFVTVWLGIIDLRSGLLRYCSAGHDYPAVMREGGEFGLLKEPNSPALALFPGIPFMGREITLAPRERVFIYTDGLAEAVNSADEQFGFDRIISCLNELRNESDKGIITGMWNRLQNYIVDEPQFDDTTMLSFTFLGQSEGGGHE